MSVATPSSFPMTVPESFAALISPHTQAFDAPKSQTGSPPLRKYMFDCYPVLPRPGGKHTLPHSAKTRKVVKTSFHNSRNPEVADYMNKRVLGLARISRDVYVAKMRYQRLRMRELEMMKAVMGDELEETQGYFGQMEHQIGQIHQDLLLDTSCAKSGSNAGQWAHSRFSPSVQRFSQDGVPISSFGMAYSRSTSTGSSESNELSTSASFSPASTSSLLPL